jgi:NAD(P)-dependent dehydrogenase (short-subunit alcohol dehydrogenase family)
MSGHLEGKVALVTGGGRGSSLTSQDRMATT